MGAGVSDWELARAVSRRGQLGVVSGTALVTMLTRRLQRGDKDGKMREALAAFPMQDVAERVISSYFVEGGIAEGMPYRPHPFPTFSQTSAQDATTLRLTSELDDLAIASNFAEVFLAKQGHDQPVGINYLYKLQWPLMPSIYGAMLAGVDAVLIGAGIPKEVPRIIDAFMAGEHAQMPYAVAQHPAGADRAHYALQFEPKSPIHAPKRPAFLAIVANHLGVRAVPNADGYILEGPTAGGHNAPPRSKELDASGQPLYGPKDEVDFKLLKSLLGAERPFWLAGAYAARLREAQDRGAVGVQVGTPFAFCRESGIEEALKARALDYIMSEGTVVTSARASPTGYPFKVLQLAGTIAEADVYHARRRVCNLGYLAESVMVDGSLQMRCSAERTDLYERKGGDPTDTADRACLCNGLLATVGFGSPGESPIMTTGLDLTAVRALVSRHGRDYSADHVIEHILSQ